MGIRTSVMGAMAGSIVIVSSNIALPFVSYNTALQHCDPHTFPEMFDSEMWSMDWLGKVNLSSHI